MNRKTIRILCWSAMLMGCGGVSMQTPNNSPVMPQQNNIQAGQWEFTIAPTDGNPNVYVESNLTTKPSGGISSNTMATALFWNQGGSSDTLAELYGYCLGVQAAFSTTGNTVTGLLFEGTNQIAQATATLSADGKSMNGSIQLSGGMSLCSTPVTASGTFTGQVIAPLNGTYKGTLSDGNPWTIQIMQNGSFDINASGTTTAQGVTTSFSFATNPLFAAYDSVIGATMTASGTATNINGSQQFQVFGRFTPDASQVSLVIQNGSQAALGTLAKQ